MSQEELDILFVFGGEVEINIKPWGEVRWRKDASSGASPTMSGALEQLKHVRQHEVHTLQG